MLQGQSLWIVLAESTHWEYEFELAHPFLFGLRDFLYQVEPYMETIGYESMFLVLGQGGIVALQDGLITYFSYYNPVWDMSW
jgi:hypothetical protein